MTSRTHLRLSPSGDAEVALTKVQRQEVVRYLATGEYETLSFNWPGQNIVESEQNHHAALTDALVRAVRERSTEVRLPAVPRQNKLRRLARSRVEPMVRGLFPKKEQEVVLALLEKSVVFVTAENIEEVLQTASWPRTAWDIANLYLESIGAELLGPEAPHLAGISQETRCYVRAEYLSGRGKFDDFIVHEAAHIFHNWKREYAGLPHTRKKEWLLEIEFRKRETFAYACEVHARILEQARGPAERLALVDEYAEERMPNDERVDSNELVDILREAAGARNGWKRVLARERVSEGMWRCGRPSRLQKTRAT